MHPINVCNFKKFVQTILCICSHFYVFIPWKIRYFLCVVDVTYFTWTFDYKGADNLKKNLDRIEGFFLSTHKLHVAPKILCTITKPHDVTP